jgi:tight adherence protein B
MMVPAVKVSLLVFLVILFAMKALSARTEDKSVDIVKRVRKFSREEDTESTENPQQKKKSLLGFFSVVFRVFTPQKMLDSIEADLIQADIPLKPEEMTVIYLASAFIPAGIAVLVLQNVTLAIMLAPVGVFTPLLFLRSAKNRRLKKFNDQLGDALGIMANSLRAGFSILQTMDSLSKELAPPISTEFGRALKEMRLGTPTEEALRNMADRIQSEDLELIVTAINIQRQVGGNLAQILDNIATTINERVRIKGEIKTLTAQGRISGMIVALLPVFLAGVIALMNPSYISLLFTHPVGLLLVGGAVVSETVGILLIRKIVNVEM